jgi:hypothetical protein
MSAHCEHAKHISGGTYACLLGKFGGRPHIGVCLQKCEHARRLEGMDRPPPNATPEKRTGTCKGCGGL